jgi:hypothetical protein
MITPMTDPMTKACARCELVKPLDDFSPDRRARDGRYSTCKACYKVAAKAKRDADPAAHRAAVTKWKTANPEEAARHIREWHERNPEVRPAAAWKGHLKNRFGITPEEYAVRLRDVTHCPICKRSREEIGRSFHLDHDHETGELREFVCGPCNQGLGLYGDDPDRLIAAAMYLMRHKGTLESLLPQLQEGTKTDNG